MHKKKKNTSVHHMYRANLLTNLFQVSSNTIGIIACIDAWFIVFLYLLFIKIYTIIMCLYYIDPL